VLMRSTTPPRTSQPVVTGTTFSPGVGQQQTYVQNDTTPKESLEENLSEEDIQNLFLNFQSTQNQSFHNLLQNLLQKTLKMIKTERNDWALQKQNEENQLLYPQKKKKKKKELNLNYLKKK